jgi:hypothetical protein
VEEKCVEVASPAKKQPLVHWRGQRGPIPGVTWQRMRVGAAGILVARPVPGGEMKDPAAEAGAKQGDEFVDRGIFQSSAVASSRAKVPPLANLHA